MIRNVLEKKAPKSEEGALSLLPILFQYEFLFIWHV